MLRERVVKLLPERVRLRVEPALQALELLATVRDPRVLGSLAPAGLRGLVLREGKTHDTADMQARHATHFQWRYPADHDEMAKLYARAKALQWDAATDLPWDIDVDPLHPDKPPLPRHFIAWDELEARGVKLDARERSKVLHDTACWVLSQFLHGEQAALFAAAQVTEAVHFFDGKLFGATQVMDEARHVEAFRRYLETKLGRVYQVNDNLFVLIDALMTDRRWDMKFLGMQIMVEGLALGAFGALYKQSKEPLLRELLKGIIRDEARHVHYGVLALRQHFRHELTDSERREREEWAFEVALLMRNRFRADEIYEEAFAHRISRRDWHQVIEASTGMHEFRTVMFSRLVPNLREIGLIGKRMLPRYEREGLMRYFNGKAATMLNDDQMIGDLERERQAAEPPLADAAE